MMNPNVMLLCSLQPAVWSICHPNEAQCVHVLSFFNCIGGCCWVLTLLFVRVGWNRAQTLPVTYVIRNYVGFPLGNSDESWLIRVFNPRWSHVATMEKVKKFFFHNLSLLSHATPNIDFFMYLFLHLFYFAVQRRSKGSPHCFHPNCFNTKELPLVPYFHKIMRSF